MIYIGIIGIWGYPLRSVIFVIVYGYPLGILFIYYVIVYGYPLGILFIYYVRTVMRTTTY
jgi:hypothetical protein